VNKYFDQYYLEAVQTAQQLRQNTTTDSRFIFTTHPWLLSLFVNCPKNIWPALHCPNTTSIKIIDDAIRKGEFTWHAFASNIQSEIIADIGLVQHGLKLARDLDDRYGIKQHKNTLSLRVSTNSIKVLTSQGCTWNNKSYDTHTC
jgi:hypothetical protein